MAEQNAVEEKFESNINLTVGGSAVLPLSNKSPLFIVGPNGVGKSGMMLSLYRDNHARALRISAHRQTWMESNVVPFSPQDKINNEKVNKGQDILPHARWKEYNPSARSGLVISNLIDADAAIARKSRDEIISGDVEKAKRTALSPTPIENINNLFEASGIYIKLRITDNSSIVASKNGGEVYSIASLSDGERAALLIAGDVLTAPPNFLILIDEPERHLHASIVTPLLTQLFAIRQDCTFVISTHELGLAVSNPDSRVVLIRASTITGEKFVSWDLDVLEPGVEIDDATKEAIIGARRKMLFIEGTERSLDQPLYQLIFPNVSVFPRSSCRDVEHAVSSVRDTQGLAWVQAFGIVDQDQMSAEKKAEMQAKGIYPLSVYSVEALYFNPTVIRAVAGRHCIVIGGNADEMVAESRSKFLSSIRPHIDRLAARMTEQAVRDKVYIGIPNWKNIKAGVDVNIVVDAQAMYSEEKERLNKLLADDDMEGIIARYPVRETDALEGVVQALKFKGRDQYISSVLRLVAEDDEIKLLLKNYFGQLPELIN